MDTWRMAMELFLVFLVACNLGTELVELWGIKKKTGSFLGYFVSCYVPPWHAPFCLPLSSTPRNALLFL